MRELGFGKRSNFAARFAAAVWSLQAKRPHLSPASAVAWVGLRYGDKPGPDTRTTAQRLADRRYNPFGEDN